MVRRGELEAVPPLMSSVWASIHRASEQAWDSALTRSFRHLLPYMVAIVAIIALVGSFGLHVNTTVQAADQQTTTSPYAVFNSPVTPVARLAFS